MTERIETIKFLTQEEIRRLIAAIADKRDRAIFVLAYRHGLRASEVGLLRKSDVNLKELRINIYRVKRSLSGTYPLQPDEARILKAYLRSRTDDSPILFPSRKNHPITRVQLHRLMKHYAEKAKLPEDKRHFHVLKHTIATHLLDAGQDVRTVQDWVGHKNIQNTMIYPPVSAGMREEKASAAFSRLPRF